MFLKTLFTSILEIIIEFMFSINSSLSLLVKNCFILSIKLLESIPLIFVIILSIFSSKKSIAMEENSSFKFFSKRKSLTPFSIILSKIISFPFKLSINICCTSSDV